MEQTSIGITLFGVIFVGLIVITIGLGGLKLLSLLVNALLGRRTPQQATKVGAWSGVVTALAVTATVFVGLVMVALLFDVRPESTPRTVIQPGNLYAHAESPFSNATVRLGHPERPGPLETIDTTRVRELGNTAELRQRHEAAELLAEAPADAAVEATLVDYAVVTATDTNVVGTAEQAAFIEARKLELELLVSKIGQYISSNLEKVGEHNGTTVLGQAAKSDNGDVVVFQPSDAMVRQILGAAGQNLLKSFNSELPGRIRQTYALIPLTPPVGSTFPVSPLLAAGGLQSIANSIVSLVESAGSVSVPISPDIQAPELSAAEAGLTIPPMIPQWVTNTDGRRIVVHTKPILDGDDAAAPLTAAINEGLAQHVQAITATMNSTLHEQAKFVRMELPQTTAKKFVVDTFERREIIETETEGPKQFQIHYALLEFPETVDQIAVRQIRQSIQRDRIMGLGIVVGFAWLSVCSAGFGIRQWQKGTRLRRIAATPLFVGITLPTLLVSVGMVLALSKGEMPLRSWNSQPVTIDLQNM